MFLITNQNVKTSQSYNGIYIAGQKINKLETENELYIYEGNINENVIKKYDFFSEKIVPRIFNVIKWDKQEKKIIIKNDQLGRMPLYLFEDGETFALTNCFWMIPEYLGVNSLKFNEDAIKQFLYLVCLINDSMTFFENVRVIEPATITTFSLKGESFESSEKKYWKYSDRRNSGVVLNLSDSVDLLDQALHRQFELIQTDFENELVGFGNSGGLDSRIVALFLSKFNKKSVGFTFLEDKKNRKSGTYRSAKKIADLANVENQFENMECSDYSFCMALDLRAAPFRRSELFKNNISGLPKFKAMIAGQHGSMVSNFGVKYKAEKNLKEVLNRRLLKLMKGFDKNLIVGDYNFDIQPLIKKLHAEAGDNVNDIFNFWLLTYSARYGYCGGFESLNRTRKSHFLYYPVVFNEIAMVDSKYLVDKFLLKEFLKRKYPKYYRVRYQNFEKFGVDEKSHLYRIINEKYTEYNYKKYGVGMSMKGDLRHAEIFDRFVNEVIEKRSSLFDKIFEDTSMDKVLGEYQKVPIFLLLNILKLKEFLLAFENEDFEKHLLESVDYF